MKKDLAALVSDVLDADMKLSRVVRIAQNAEARWLMAKKKLADKVFQLKGLSKAEYDQALSEAGFDAISIEKLMR